MSVACVTSSSFRSSALFELYKHEMMLKKSKGLTWPFLGLALASVLVYLGGLAATQVCCCLISWCCCV